MKKLSFLFIFLAVNMFCENLIYAVDLKGRVDTPKVTAQQAMDNVKRVLPELGADTGRFTYSAKGDTKLDVPLILNGNMVAYVRLNPTTGEILPKGYRAWTPKKAVSAEDGTVIVQKTISKMSVGNPWQSVNGQWKVPLVLNGSVIAEIRVDGNDGKIIYEKKERKAKK
jgi:hypothetical protein